MKKFDWYIIKKFLSTFFFTISLILIIVIVFDIYEKIDDLNTANKYYNIAFTLVPHNLELNFLLGKTAYNLGNIEDYAEFISNLEILCDNDCDEIDNLKLLAE